MLNLSSLAAKLLKLIPKPLQPILKAIAAAILPLVSVSLLNGSFDYKAIVAAVATAIAVYFVPNVKPVAVAKPPAAGK